jgi:hypothetical protein
MSKKFAPNPTASLRRVQSVRTGMSLSDIKNVPVEQLTTNSQNAQYFQRESDEYFRQLREDIEKRGVVVPLLAKQDGTLLAGHNRLEIARAIGLRFVPVQYVQEELSARQEQEFIINDNLLRRQLTQEQRIHLYKQLFPEFDVVVQGSKRGGDKKSSDFKTTKNQKDSVSLIPNGSNPLSYSVSGKATTINHLAEKIATTTGQKVSTVKQQISRAKSQTNQNEHQKKNQKDNDSLIVPTTKPIIRLKQILQELSRETDDSIRNQAKTLIDKALKQWS